MPYYETFADEEDDGLGELPASFFQDNIRKQRAAKIAQQAAVDGKHQSQHAQAGAGQLSEAGRDERDNKPLY